MDFLDQKEIATLLAKELFYQQFINLDGIHSGVPTITTPTLTPTTLRNIEQTFIELQCKPESHENEAGFVPPLVHSIGNHYISATEADIYSSKSNSNIWQSSLSQSSSDSNSRPTPPATPISGTQTPAPSGRRNMGGRKPQKDVNISPEEEERRKIRRERNKAAAARCRKRRVDHTNSLIQETEGLEEKKQALQQELQELHVLKEELEFALEQHRTSQLCQLQDRATSPPDIKPYQALPVRFDPARHAPIERVKTEVIEHLPEPDDDFCLPSPAKKIMLSSAAALVKPNRPNSLNVATGPLAARNASELSGVLIQTPSTGIQFNFDSLMLGGTGLTPVNAPLAPNCSTQQRIPVSAADITSPDNCNPPKLVSL